MRNRIMIDPKEVEALSGHGCTVEEICTKLKISRDTLYRKYRTALKEGAFIRNRSLRRKMYETAMGGNVTMMIWLSKQFLGYRDKQELNGPDPADTSSLPPTLILKFVKAKQSE
jgi:hypothetical protein